MTEIEKRRVILLLIGKVTDGHAFDIDTLPVDRLDMDDLLKAYSAANIYLSTSIDDAGLSMVNQSVACGTPVVSFNIGTALDVVKNGVSGYMANLKDSEDMANGIDSIFRLPIMELRQLQYRTRMLALEMNSMVARERYNNAVYEKMLYN